MLEKTLREIVETLFFPPDNKHWWRRERRMEDWTDSKIQILVAMILDLLMEVEALRAALLATDAGATGKDSAYGRVYRSTAYLTHNSCGTSAGLEKLLALFYPDKVQANRRTWRESLMLRRIGFSEADIGTYKEEAEQAETFT